jgi:hypothetical protein
MLVRKPAALSDDLYKTWQPIATNSIFYHSFKCFGLRFVVELNLLFIAFVFFHYDVYGILHF